MFLILMAVVVSAQDSDPDPMALLRGVEDARMAVRSGELVLDANYKIGESTQPNSGTGRFLVVFSDSSRRFIHQEADTYCIMHAGAAFTYDGESVIIDAPENGGAKYLFDPRILGITRSYRRDASVGSCLHYNDAKEITLVGQEELDGRDTWRVRVVDSFDQQHDFWIEMTEGFPVHRYEYRTELAWDVTIAEYGGPNPAMPSYVVTKSTFRGEDRDVQEFRVTEANYNEKVEPDSFELGGLSPSIGVPVSDVRIKRRLGYWDGEGLVDNVPRPGDITPLTEVSGSYWPWLIGTSIILLVIGGYLVYRRREKA